MAILLIFAGRGALGDVSASANTGCVDTSGLPTACVSVTVATPGNETAYNPDAGTTAIGEAKVCPRKRNTRPGTWSLLILSQATIPEAQHSLQWLQTLLTIMKPS